MNCLATLGESNFSLLKIFALALGVTSVPLIEDGTSFRAVPRVEWTIVVLSTSKVAPLRFSQCQTIGSTGITAGIVLIDENYLEELSNLFLFILSLHDGLHGCLDDRSGHRPHTQPNLVQIVAAFLNTSRRLHVADGSQNMTLQGEPDRKTDWSRNLGTGRFHATWMERLGSLGASSMVVKPGQEKWVDYVDNQEENDETGSESEKNPEW
ncbi:hypothetical protein O9K51_08482 [Purpureocillium lavendulum]|uniref:Uncharacterized protein n=1 Tax=Purpureocillium lavendulum TaxID=1247861 RepID=A0AB34FKY5_9HYPO|nr:hypothetical protein O9K51_08482 [Purpureocillium lavendulum]